MKMKSSQILRACGERSRTMRQICFVGQFAKLSYLTTDHYF